MPPSQQKADVSILCVITRKTQDMTHRTLSAIWWINCALKVHVLPPGYEGDPHVQLDGEDGADG